jgi:hypothetical protein
MRQLAGNVSVRVLEDSGICMADVREQVRAQFGDALAVEYDSRADALRFFIDDSLSHPAYDNIAVPILRLYGRGGTYSVALSIPYAMNSYLATTQTKVVPTRSKKLLLT